MRTTQAKDFLNWHGLNRLAGALARVLAVGTITLLVSANGWGGSPNYIFVQRRQ